MEIDISRPRSRKKEEFRFFLTLGVKLPVKTATKAKIANQNERMKGKNVWFDMEGAEVQITCFLLLDGWMD